jgi:hypothetical protein
MLVRRAVARTMPFNRAAMERAASHSVRFAVFERRPRTMAYTDVGLRFLVPSSD